MAKSIDLNADAGESVELIRNGQQEAILMKMSSVNVSCGAHAGDAMTARLTMEQALRYGVAVGAHPSYPDRENFGRVELAMPPAALVGSVHAQLSALAGVAKAVGARIVHVKPHGALYNVAARDARVAKAIAEGVRLWRRDVALFALADSVSAEVYRAEGFRVVEEGFADRAYLPDGSLMPRTRKGAVLTDPEAAARQAVAIADVVDSICLHSDSPGAMKMAHVIRQRLEQAGYVIQTPLYQA